MDANREMISEGGLEQVGAGMAPTFSTSSSSSSSSMLKSGSIKVDPRKMLFDLRAKKRVI